jgi:hypothetical protein
LGSKQKGCHGASKSPLSSHALSTRVFAEKIALRPLERVLSAVRSAYVLMVTIRFFVSSLRRKLCQRPISRVLSDASPFHFAGAGQGLPCRFAGLGPIRKPRTVRAVSDLVLPLFAPARLLRRGTSPRGRLTNRPRSEAKLKAAGHPAAHAGSLYFNRVQSRKGGAALTPLVFPYVPSGLRQPGKARIGLTDSSLSPDAETVGRRDEKLPQAGKSLADEPLP